MVTDRVKRRAQAPGAPHDGRGGIPHLAPGTRGDRSTLSWRLATGPVAAPDRSGTSRPVAGDATGATRPRLSAWEEGTTKINLPSRYRRSNVLPARSEPRGWAVSRRFDGSDFT